MFDVPNVFYVLPYPYGNILAVFAAVDVPKVEFGTIGIRSAAPSDEVRTPALYDSHDAPGFQVRDQGEDGSLRQRRRRKLGRAERKK